MVADQTIPSIWEMNISHTNPYPAFQALQHEILATMMCGQSSLIQLEFSTTLLQHDGYASMAERVTASRYGSWVEFVESAAKALA